MGRYVIRRLLWSAAMLFLVIGMVFVIFFMLPGGAGHRTLGGYPPVAVMIAGKNPTPATINAVIIVWNSTNPCWFSSVTTSAGSFMVILAIPTRPTRA